MYDLIMWNDVIDPVDSDQLEEIGTALHWTLLDAADLEYPIHHRWQALQSTYRVAGQTHLVESCLDEHATTSRHLGGMGYRLESILHSHAENGRQHAESVDRLLEEVREYNGAAAEHREDPTWQTRLEHWRERLELWKDQVNEQYHENDANCQRALRGYIEDSLWRMDYRFPQGPRPTEEDQASWPEPDSPWLRALDPPMIRFPMPLPEPRMPEFPVFTPGPARVEMVQTLELKTTPMDPAGHSEAGESGGSGGRGRLLAWGGTSEDGGTGRARLGASEMGDEDEVNEGNEREDRPQLGGSGKPGLGGAAVEDDGEDLRNGSGFLLVNTPGKTGWRS